MATPGVALPASDWISWNWVCLRGAGFPVTLAIELAASDASRAVDAMLAAERECREARTAALRALREEERHASDAARMSELRKAGKLVTKNRPPPAIDLSESAQREVERMRRALSAVDASRVAAEAAFSTDRAATRRALVTAAQDGRFREAVAWQNRHAIGSALDVLLASPETFDSETRR